MSESIRRFKGGDGAVGDERLFLYGSQPALRTIAGRDWLATGAIAAYAAKHATLAAECPGLVGIALPARIAMPAGQVGLTKVLHNGTGYLWIASGVSAGSIFSAYATTLAGLLAGSIGSPGLTRARGAAVVDTTFVVVGDNGSHGAAYYNGSGWVDVASLNSIPLIGIASNGTDAVAIVSGYSTTATNAMYLTANGSGFAPQSGSGGPSFVMEGIAWCPVASKYLIYGAGSVNATTNGYSGQTACTVPAGVTFPVIDERSVASSATVTLIKVANNQILRTTDGATFTLVDLLVENMPSGYLRDIVYDGSRFIAQINQGGGAASMFVYSTTGAAGTWAASPAFDDIGWPGVANFVCYGMSVANGKWLMNGGQFSGAIATMYDMSSIAWPLVPTRVGALKARNDGDSQVYIRVT